MKKILVVLASLCMISLVSCNDDDSKRMPSLTTDALSEVLIDAQGGTSVTFINVDVSEGVWDYSISPSSAAEWLSVVRSKTVSGLELSALPNTGLEDRTAVIILVSDNATPCEIQIRQKKTERATSFFLDGLTESSISILMTDGMRMTAVRSDDGTYVLPVSDTIHTIYSLVTQTTGETLLGRKEGETIRLKFEGGKLTFRDKVDGMTPIGSFAEMDMIRTSDAAMKDNYIQDADIDMLGQNRLAETKGIERHNWMPIGYWRGDNDIVSFEGSFDGSDYEISNLYCNRPELNRAVGLFGWCSGVGNLSGIVLTDCDVSGQQFVGGICGVNQQTGFMSYCKVIGGSVTGIQSVGGVCAYKGGGGNVSDCHNINTSVSSSASGLVGGVFGWVDPGPGGASQILVLNCSNSGNVDGLYNVGGICGLTKRAYVFGCRNTGGIIGDETVGGVVGSVNEGYLVASYNTGTVEVRQHTMGGVAGENLGIIVACYSIGETFCSTGSTATVGGILGYNYHTVAYCYWLQRDEDRAPKRGIGEATVAAIGDSLPFSAQNWPSSEVEGWGIGQGENNSYWASLGSFVPGYYPGGIKSDFPKLWWE